MTCTCSPSGAAGQYFDEAKARRELAAYHRGGPGKTTRRLIDGLAAHGAHGTLLDGGAGTGVLTLELLKAAVTRATCVDLSAGSLGVAREEAQRQGLADRISWQEGDLVDLGPALPAADIVTLDRVVCCYPSYRELLDAATSHSRRWLALSYPRDRWYVRVSLWFGTLWLRIRGSAFRAFVHPVTAIDAVLQDAGFAAVRHATTLAWQASIYERKASDRYPSHLPPLVSEPI